MTKISQGALASSLLALALAVPSLAAAQSPTVEIGGRLMLDYTIADLDGPDGTIDGSEVRRARIHAKGKFSDTISYKFELNKTGADAFNMEDAYLEFAPKSTPIKIRVGQDNTTNSFDELTSSRFTSTIERAAFTDAFQFGRRLGITVLTKGDNYTFDAGIYADNLEGSDFDTEGRAASARATFTPVKSDDMIIHLGASARYRKSAENDDNAAADLFRYRQRPFSHVAPNRIVNTGRFAETDTFVGAEAMVLRDAFWAAGEYGLTSAKGFEAQLDANFGGGYIEAGYFFGGRRTYGSTVFKRYEVDAPVGKGGMGAFSVVARYDTLDLEDGDTFDQALDTVILGADWYPTTHTRLGVNYFNADAKNGSAESAEGVVARLYFDF
jgi:phosphate-selective porin OprO/OprP